MKHTAFITAASFLSLHAASVAAPLIVGAKVGGQTPVSAVDSACVMDTADAAWLKQSLQKWEKAEVGYLGLAKASLPTVHTFDARCAYKLIGGDPLKLTTHPISGNEVRINGRNLPVGPISFADGSGTFVMSLPSVWRAKGVNGTFGLERLMDAVLLHEMMHTRQAALASAALDSIERSKPTGVELSDDLVQQTFGKNSNFVRAYEKERDLLFAAAGADSETEARRLAATAYAAMQERRALYFTGPRAYLSHVEDVFLTMEGMGQWLGYRMFIDLGVTSQAALKEVRRGGAYWSQDEGLAIVLVLDRLLPDWKRRAFDPQRWGAGELLKAAIATPANVPPSCKHQSSMQEN